MNIAIKNLIIFFFTPNISNKVLTSYMHFFLLACACGTIKSLKSLIKVVYTLTKDDEVS